MYPWKTKLNGSLYLLSLGYLLLLIWSLRILIQHPYLGAFWSYSSGVIYSVDPSNPPLNSLKVGDRILSVDGQSVWEAQAIPDAQAGSTVTLIVERGGKPFEAHQPLVAPPTSILTSRLSPVPIALAFWLIGILALVFSKNGKEAILFYLYCLVVGLSLALGNVSSMGPLWARILFGVFLCIGGPLAIHTHFELLRSRSTNFVERLLPWQYFLMLLLIGLSLAEFLAPTSSFFSALSRLQFLWLALNLVLLIGMVAKTRLSSETPETRQKAALLVLATTIGLLPLLVFSLLPDALLSQQFVPYDITMLFLISLPLGYGYGIFRQRLLRLDRYVNRSAAVLLTIFTAGAIYTLVYTLLSHLLPDSLQKPSGLNFLVFLILALTFYPLYRQLQKIVDSVFYGGWYDIPSAVQKVSQAAGSQSDLESLASAFLDGLQQIMQLECACLALPQRNDQLMKEDNFTSCPASLGQIHFLAEDSPLFGGFPDPLTPVEPPVLRKQLYPSSLSHQEASLLDCPISRLWIPLIGGGSLLGILSLGPKRGAGQFSGQDRQILDMIARYMSIAIQNSYLIADLRTMAQEHTQLHRRAITAGEQERKRLARELHDQSIQALSGLNYQLSSLKRGLRPQTKLQVEQLQGEVQAIITGLRAICARLRPPSLDSLGLTTIVQAYIQSMNSKASFLITLKVEGNEPADLSEEMTLCIYQALQEALANVQKHAQAHSVQVILRFHSEGVALTVEDDGKGFLLPQRLGKFVQAGHFGLMGVEERVDILLGKLSIISSPGQGCKLTVEIPCGPIVVSGFGQPEQLSPKE